MGEVFPRIPDGVSKGDGCGGEGELRSSLSLPHLSLDAEGEAGAVLPRRPNAALTEASLKGFRGLTKGAAGSPLESRAGMRPVLASKARREERRPGPAADFLLERRCVLSEPSRQPQSDLGRGCPHPRPAPPPR